VQVETLDKRLQELARGHPRTNSRSRISRPLLVRRERGLAREVRTAGEPQDYEEQAI
jgi:hypothetical protein